MAAPYKFNWAQYEEEKAAYEKHLIEQNNRRLKNIMHDLARVQEAKEENAFDRLVRKMQSWQRNWKKK